MNKTISYRILDSGFDEHFNTLTFTGNGNYYLIGENGSGKTSLLQKLQANENIAFRIKITKKEISDILAKTGVTEKDEVFHEILKPFPIRIVVKMNSDNDYINNVEEVTLINTLVDEHFKNFINGEIVGEWTKTYGEFKKQLISNNNELITLLNGNGEPLKDFNNWILNDNTEIDLEYIKGFYRSNWNPQSLIGDEFILNLKPFSKIENIDQKALDKLKVDYKTIDFEVQEKLEGQLSHTLAKLQNMSDSQRNASNMFLHYLTEWVQKYQPFLFTASQPKNTINHSDYVKYKIEIDKVCNELNLKVIGEDDDSLTVFNNLKTQDEGSVLSDGHHSIIFNIIIRSTVDHKAALLWDEPFRSLDNRNIAIKRNEIHNNEKVNLITTHNMWVLTPENFDNVFVISSHEGKRRIHSLSEIDAMFLKRIENKNLKEVITSMINSSIFNFMAGKRNILFVEGTSDMHMLNSLMSAGNYVPNFSMISLDGVGNYKLFMNAFSSENDRIKYLADNDTAGISSQRGLTFSKKITEDFYNIVDDKEIDTLEKLISGKVWPDIKGKASVIKRISKGNKETLFDDFPNAKLLLEKIKKFFPE